MSLSNPNKPVTEERLQEFYHKIVPYMGGAGGSTYTAGDGIDITEDVISTKQSEEGDIDEIIDVYPQAGSLVSIVNAFNRGDLYSTEERMIGQWIDGKPLYQKTFFISALPNNSEQQFSIDLSNVDNIADVKGVCKRNDSVIVRPLPYIYGRLHNGTSYTAELEIGIWLQLVNNSWKVVVNTGADRSDHSAYITIQYTKTTDTAISIGSETEYSTDEKVIGTWIDGKPVYQKTFIVTSGITNDNAIELQGGCDVLVGYMLNYANVPSWGVYVPEYVGRGVASSKLENLLQICPIIDYTTHKLTVTPRIGSSVSSISELAVTIQYTKSTT